MDQTKKPRKQLRSRINNLKTKIHKTTFKKLKGDDKIAKELWYNQSIDTSNSLNYTKN